VSCDWNVSPASAIIAQSTERFAPDAAITNRKIYSVSVLEEISLENSNTPELLEELRSRLFRLRGRRAEKLAVNVTCDASGNQRKSSAENTDIELLKRMFKDNSEYFRASYFIEKANPPQRDSAERCSALFREGTLRISPACRELALDLHKLTYRTDSPGNVTSSISKSDPMRGHCGDCLRYLCWQIAKPKRFCGERSENLLF
jgi:hypothetical protein